MKKIVVLVQLCLLFFVIFGTKQIYAAKSDFVIEEESGDKILTKYKGNNKNVRVPEGVTRLEGYVFMNNKNIKKIELPNTVKFIGGFSFYNLKNLKSVKLSKNLEWVEGNAFMLCPKIKKIIIPKKCKRIDTFAFGGCTGLKKIVVEKGNNNYIVKKEALYSINMDELILYPPKCKKYKTYIIPKVVDVIADGAFNGNKYIEKLVINSNICDTYDEGGTCENMKRLKKVVYRKKQTYKDGLCFANCKKLEKVVLAEGTKYIGYKQFYGCTNLKAINFPVSLTMIAENAFEGCVKLVLPDFDKLKIRECD